ncbi:hypothetical protein Goklo_020953 [Gossypium klotzschianum]|uniref:Uncharacterized protein n=1 Tax=Gossypium klotzschianum TaxID=34286 RepID=A0A7J8UTI2_9ROSI|nr:hypothetical protein [Gossypium klotzschianum]
MTCLVEKTIAALVGTSIGSLLLLKMFFPYYDQLTAIYTKDRAIRKDAQTAADIVEEIDVEDVDTTNTHGERNDFHGCEVDISLDDMDLSATQLQPPRNQGDSTFSKKKKKDF